jgi:hypothetical protein
MIEALLSGDALGAMAWNPLLFIALAALALWAATSAAGLIFGLPTWRVVLAPREKLGLRFLAAAAIAAGWAYLIWQDVMA